MSNDEPLNAACEEAVGIEHGTPEEAEFAAKVANDISENIDCRETRAQLREVIRWWAMESCSNFSKYRSTKDRQITRAFKQVVQEHTDAALTAQAAEIGSLRLEVEGLRNQRDSAQRSSMEAKDQLAAQAAELARLRDDAKLLDLLDIVIDGKELIEFRAATEMQQIAPRRQAMRPNGKVALFSIATQHIVADDARDALRKLSAALAQIRETRDKPLSP